MKTYKYLMIAIAVVALASCSDMDKQDPLGYALTDEQLTESSELAESRGEATFAGMYTMMGQPYFVFGTQYRADDFGFVMMAISQDCEGPDLDFPNSGYNWFAPCGEMSSRYPSYANPYIRYAIPYDQIAMANDIINMYSNGGEESVESKQKIAQARAMRAFDYMALAPYFQFNYQVAADEPCVPIVTEEAIDFSNNPRATVREVYQLIIDDLDYAIENLDGFVRSDKAKIDQQVAYGLRARAYLAMGEYANAAADAEKAMEGYTPASIVEVSTPSFYDINDHNWIWGIDLTLDQVRDEYASAPAWIGSFSASSYSAGVQVYATINNLLWNKIPSTDVRKGWWVDENLHSDLLSTISWDGVTGDAISTLEIDDVKMEFLPYTNVKFGMMSGIGSTFNDNDWPLMRVEEMILVAAEGYAKSGNESKARELLNNFVKNYRDTSYDVANYVPSFRKTLEDEIWFQRRVELWGEGFAWSDLMRLQKPLVRFHDGEESSLAEAYQFNMEQGDGWMLMRFSQSETNTNAGIVDNTEGTLPSQYQNGNLRDGVTD